MFSGNHTENINKVTQNNVFECSASVRCLGLHIDDNLKCHNQIAFVIGNLSRSIGIMERAKFLLSTRELTLIYNTIILPM